jgi:hypothetical protein
MKFLENLEFSVTALFTQDSEEPVLDDDGKPLYKGDGSPKTKKVKSKSLQIAFRDAAKDKDIALAVVKCNDVEEDVAKEMIGKVFEKFPLQIVDAVYRGEKVETVTAPAATDTKPETVETNG